eukprot:CAMPEP_0202463178 /NCGR_PEP_ID=MMETSP1360-20130828/57080_1 /ASSEMBLY_ACC=CAM_ASM_000848 /TAXON_ID=515479 /ORGANISM="Licmophora paradoxa, Strain CCMP2313" /LENGTH=55 /DNA_ID=CAMNT_0049085961 /DNA_START=127 /DNA_END=294 /DNA_ORIENTATION=-
MTLLNSMEACTSAEDVLSTFLTMVWKATAPDRAFLASAQSWKKAAPRKMPCSFCV